jgi:hypothetical protein
LENSAKAANVQRKSDAGERHLHAAASGGVRHAGLGDLGRYTW